MECILKDRKKNILSLHNVKVFFKVEKNLLDRLFALGKLRFVHAVDDVSIGVARGDTLGIVGESGSGKSTLGYSIIGLVELTAGDIIFKDTLLSGNISKNQKKNISKKIQMIFQDPYSSLNPNMRIGEIISRPLYTCGEKLTRKEIKEKIIEISDDVGLKKDDMNKYPHEFSGGQKQRIAIARGLIVEPEIIIADEITSSLDVSIQSQILNLLIKMKSNNLSMIYITHDLRVARLLNDYIAIMYMGKIVEYGQTSEIYNNPLHPYTKALLSAIPGGKIKKKIHLKGKIPSLVNPKPGCRLYERCPYRMRICMTEYPKMISDNSKNHFVACHLEMF